jgi:hypothetical protein
MDKSRVYKGTYKGYFSVTIESEIVRVEMLPELGGKLVSIIYKPTGKEWLLDSGERTLKQPEYGSTFTDWDMSGWDECFPTIITCLSGTEQAINLPDHGELWSLPWEYTLEESAVVCSVRSPQLPYKFIRRISFQSAKKVHMEYRVENEGGFGIPFLWVPHPQFAVDEPTRILLPPTATEMLCVYGGNTLQAGVKYDWDSVSLLTSKVTGNGLKFYYSGKINDGWSGMFGLESDSFLIVSVPVDKVPYIGIWMDTGMFNDRVTCALEPSIGYYDSLETALSNGTSQKILPKSSFEWHLDITLGNGDWERITNDL